MFNKASYVYPIKHAVCSSGEHEIPSEPLMAMKMDDEDGIAVAIGFHTGMLNKVDYFLENNRNIQLIELSDLEECRNRCDSSIKKALAELQMAQESITKRQELDIIRLAWKDIKVEFEKKWSGSIAVVERLYRKTNQLADADPNYHLLIVCKNHTDVKMLDVLKRQLSGMMGDVNVCNTETLKSYLIKII